MTEKYTIRRFELDDIPAIIEIVKREVPALPHYRDVIIDEKDLTFTLEHNINNDGYICVWVLCDSKGNIVGGSSGYCVKLLFSKDLSANDIFLFIKPEHRTLQNAVGLIRTYKKWATARNAKMIGVTHTGGYKPEQLDKLLQREGFTPIGSIYRLRRD